MLSKWIIFHLRMGMEGLTPVFWLCPDRKFFTWPQSSGSQHHSVTHTDVGFTVLSCCSFLSCPCLKVFSGCIWEAGVSELPRSFIAALHPNGQHSCHSNVCLLPQQFSNNRLNSHMQNFWIRAQIGEQSLTYTSFSIINWCDRFISQENLQSEQSNVTLILEA